MNKSPKFATLARVATITLPALALLTFLLLNYSQSARAGWSVNVGVTGSGTVTLKVSNPSGTNTVKTPFMKFPSAAINKQSNFVFSITGVLPANSSPDTYVQVRAFTNYITSIQSRTAGGDINDNDEVLQFVIPSSACASSDLVVVPVQILSNSITFHYSAKLSDEGSAVLIRVVDALTGQQRYVVLLTGPSDNTSNTCEGTFTVIGNPEHLNLLLDGNTSTLPFSIACPNDMVISCATPLSDTYNPPAVVTGVTGPFAVTYDPLPSQLVLGITNIVTVTARDTNGCVTMCQFKVYRKPISFDGFYAPISGADATGGTCNAPLRSLRLGNVLPVKFAMSCDGQPVTGVPVITIQNCNSPGIVYQGPFQPGSGEWHFNIDSSVIRSAGTYSIIATLPDGSQHTAVVQYRR